MTNKRYGRVGDSPIIGAGTYADAALRGIGDRLGRVLHPRGRRPRHLRAHGLPEGNPAAGRRSRDQPATSPSWAATAAPSCWAPTAAIAIPFNTEGMYRGWIGADGVPHVALYSSETLPSIRLPAQPSPDQFGSREPERGGAEPGLPDHPGSFICGSRQCPVDSARTTGQNLRLFHPSGHSGLIWPAGFIESTQSGGIPKRPTGADCKSAGLRLRWFESTSLHQFQVSLQLSCKFPGAGVVQW